MSSRRRRETLTPLPSVGEGRERGKNATQAAGVGRLQAADRRGPATALKAQTIKEDERKNLKASPSLSLPHGGGRGSTAGGVLNTGHRRCGGSIPLSLPHGGGRGSTAGGVLNTGHRRLAHTPHRRADGLRPCRAYSPSRGE